MDEFALKYEWFIRRAHQCGRYGVTGADADTFRRLEENAYNYFTLKSKIENKSEKITNPKYEQYLIRYMTKFGEVSGYIKTAIEFVMKKYDESLSEEQGAELENIELLLSEPVMENIYETINRADKVMLDIGLFPQ